MKSRVYFKGHQVMMNVFTAMALFLLMLNPCYAAPDPMELPTTLHYSLSAGYHTVSIPVNATDMTISKLFPNVVNAGVINKDSTYTPLNLTDKVTACQPLYVYLPIGGGSYAISGQPAIDKIELQQVKANASGITAIPAGSFLVQGKVKVKVDGVEATAGGTGVNTFYVMMEKENGNRVLLPSSMLEPLQCTHYIVVTHAPTASLIDITLTPLNAGRMPVTIIKVTKSHCHWYGNCYYDKTTHRYTRDQKSGYEYTVEYEVQNPQAEADAFKVFCDARTGSCKKGESGYSKPQSIAANSKVTGTITVKTTCKQADKIILYITNTEAEHIISKAEKAIQ